MWLNTQWPDMRDKLCEVVVGAVVVVAVDAVYAMGLTYYSGVAAVIVGVSHFLVIVCSVNSC